MKTKITWKGQLVNIKASGETWEEARLRNNTFKEIGRAEALEEVEKVLPLCDVCGGSHGKWVDADKLKEKLSELNNKA